MTEEKQTVDSFYSSQGQAPMGKRKTLAEWEKELGTATPESPTGEPLLTEEQARGVIARRNLMKKARALGEMIQRKRPILKKNAQPQEQERVRP